MIRFSFISVDSIVWATYQLPNGIIENSNSILVFTVTTYTKPDLFYTKLNNYFNGGFSDKPDKIEHQIPQKFCTFNGDGHLVSDILGETNLLYTKIK